MANPKYAPGKQGKAAGSAPTAQPLRGSNTGGGGTGGGLSKNYSGGKGSAANGRNPK